MLYNNPSGTSNSQGISISGNSSWTVNLSALTSGPYVGILFWQSRTAPQTMSISGGGNFTMVGTFYAADALLTITGSGTATIGSQYISRTLDLGQRPDHHKLLGQHHRPAAGSDPRGVAPPAKRGMKDERERL